jgi:hypothetical protein
VPAAAHGRARRGQQDVRRRAAGARPPRRQLPGPLRRAGRDRGAVRVGQVDPAPRDGDARAPNQGDGVHHRLRRRPALRSGAVGPARDSHRVRLPAVLPRRAFDSPRQRRRRAALCRGARGDAARARGPGAGDGGARPPGRLPPDPALGGRTPAGGDRPGAGRGARDRARRRAHRQPGQRLRRRHLLPAPGAQRGRRHHRSHHPRPRPGRQAPAADRDPRRPHRGRPEPGPILVSPMVLQRQ